MESFGTTGANNAASKSWWNYQHGSLSIRTPFRLTEDQQQMWAQHNMDSGLYDEEKDKKQEYHRADLINNQSLINSFKQFYRAEHNGEEFQGTNEDAINEYYSTMRWGDSNTAVMADRAMKLTTGRYDLQTRIALKDMYSVWDKTVSGFEDDGMTFKSLVSDPAKFFSGASWENSGKAIATNVMAQVADPLNYLGFIPGLNLSSKMASNAAKFSMRALVNDIKEVGIKEGLKKVGETNLLAGARAGAVQGGVENALQNSVLNASTQSVEQQLGLRKDLSIGENLASSAIAGIGGAGFGAFFGGLMPNEGGGKSLLGLTEKELAQEEAVKTRLSNRSKLMGDVVEAEKVYRSAIETNQANAGEVRAVFRDKANMAYREVLGNYISATGKESKFKIGNTSVSIGSLVEGEHMLNFMDNVGVKPTDDLASMISKVSNYVPSPEKDIHLTAGVTGGVQQQAVLTGLLNAAWYDIKDSEIHSNTDIYNLTKKWIEGNNKLTENTSEAGFVLRLAQERNKLAFNVKDLEGLSGYDQVALVDALRKFGDEGEAIGALNRLKAFNASSTAAGKVMRFADKLNSVSVLNMLGTANTAIGNMFGHLRMPAEIVERYLGSAYRGSSAGREFSEAQVKSFFENMDFHAMSSQIMDTFKLSQEHMQTSMYNERIKQGYGHFEDFSSVGAIWRQMNADPTDATGKTTAGMFTTAPDEVNIVKDAGRILTNTVMGLTRLMGEKVMLTTDEIGSQLATRSHLFAQLYTQATADGMDRKAAAAYAAQQCKEQLDAHVIAVKTGTSLTENASPELTKALIYAKHTKFQGELEKGYDIGQLGTWASGMKDIRTQSATSVLDALAKSGRSVVLTHTLPFIRTPANILNYNFEHTPILAMASKRFRRIMETGSELEKDQATGALLMGMLGWVGAMDAAVTGNVTGGGPDRWNQKKIAKGGTTEGGVRAPQYQLTIAGHSFDLRSAAPFTFPAMIMGDIADFYRYGGAELGNHAVMGMALHAAKFMMDYPAIKGLGALAKGVQDVIPSSDNPNKSQTVLKGIARAFKDYIPMTGFLRNFPEEHHRDAYDWLDELKRGVPFYNPTELGFQRDPISGHIVKYSTFDSGETLSWPLLKTVKYAVDDVNQEIMKQRLDIAAIPYGFNGEDLRQYRSSVTGRPMYDRLQEHITEAKLHGGAYAGLDLYHALDKLINSDGYLSNNTEEVYYPQNSEGVGIGNNMTRKQAALHYVINMYRQQALVTFEAELKDEARKGDKESIKLLQNLQARRMATNKPSLFL